ncbi:hypothetical protein Ptr902_12442 [Pyrenophora tritici-repentis]|nr:hypothetical protein Ptr902_12442 [Pyrenophora tritici-repentis]
MQFNTMIAAAIFASSAIARPVIARQDQGFIHNNNNCNKANNCCFSSKDACARQLGGLLGFNTFILCNTNDDTLADDFCNKLGVSTANCTADCCRIDNATGRNCPKAP